MVRVNKWFVVCCAVSLAVALFAGVAFMVFSFRYELSVEYSHECFPVTVQPGVGAERYENAEHVFGVFRFKGKAQAVQTLNEALDASYAEEYERVKSGQAGNNIYEVLMSYVQHDKMIAVEVNKTYKVQGFDTPAYDNTVLYYDLQHQQFLSLAEYLDVFGLTVDEVRELLIESEMLSFGYDATTTDFSQVTVEDVLVEGKYMTVIYRDDAVGSERKYAHVAWTAK